MFSVLNKFNKLKDPDKNKVIEFIKILEKNSIENFLVGGCVRDICLDIIPKDYDIAHNFEISELKNILNKYNIKTIDTGIEHGTITAIFKNVQIELTRYRKDVATDGRRATIEYSKTINEDLSRRDFTMNAIAFNPINEKIIDEFNGLRDIDEKKIRFVNNTKDRILEDQLRVLRYIRFLLKYNLKYNREDLNLIKEYFDSSYLSIERINMEIEKILPIIQKSNNLEVLNFLSQIHIYKKILNMKDQNIIFNKILNYKNETFNTNYPLFSLFVEMSKFNKNSFELLKINKDYKNLRDLFLNSIENQNVNNVKLIFNLQKRNLDIFSEEINCLIKYLFESYNFNYNNFKNFLNNINEKKLPINFKKLDITVEDLLNLNIKQNELNNYFIKILTEILEEKIPNDKLSILKFVDENLNIFNFKTKQKIKH